MDVGMKIRPLLLMLREVAMGQLSPIESYQQQRRRTE